MHEHTQDRLFAACGIASVVLELAGAGIATAGGKTHRLSQQAARGSDVNPLDDADLEQKLRTAAADWEPRQDIVPLIDAIWTLDTSADVSKLASLAVPRG